MAARLTTIRIDDVANFETNVACNSRSVAGMAIVTGISAAVTVACLANPKACFGSCPTFYIDDGRRPVLMAEGFVGLANLGLLIGISLLAAVFADLFLSPLRLIKLKPEDLRLSLACGAAG